MILDKLLKRFHPREDPPESWYMTGEDWITSDAGESIGPESAMYLSGVYACVRILSESVASLPLKVYRRREDGGKDLAGEHPLYRILHDEPNGEMTSFTWREAGQSHLALWGNSYSQIVTNKAGQVASIWPLRPDRMSVERNAKGAIQYIYTKDNNEKRTLRADEVLHIPGLGFNGLVGYSPISMARNSLGLARATEKFGSKLFVNGAMPKVVLTSPPGVKLSDKARQNLVESWETNYQGVLKSHKTAVLEDGMDIKTIGVPPEDAQFLETRKFQLQEIARIFRIPPHMLADLDRATFSNIEHQSIEFVVHVLRPWLVRWEQSINRRLFTEAERQQGYFVEHLVDGLLRGDIKSRYEAYSIARTGGWFSANDIRSMENMNPIEGGDIYLQPLNMVEAGKEPDADEMVRSFVSLVGEESEKRFGAVLNRTNREDLKTARNLVDGVLTRAEPAQEEEEGERARSIAASFSVVLRNQFERACKRERQDVTRMLEKGQDVGEYYRQHIDWTADQVMPAVRAMAIALSRNGKLSEDELFEIEKICWDVVVNHIGFRRAVDADTFRGVNWDGVIDLMTEYLVNEIMEVM